MINQPQLQNTKKGNNFAANHSAKLLVEQEHGISRKCEKAEREREESRIEGGNFAEIGISFNEKEGERGCNVMRVGVGQKL